MTNVETNAIRDFEKFLLFIGSPRTGSTLLGQIINYHPQCIISNESRFATNIIINGISYEKAIKMVVKKGYEQFKAGLEKAPHYGKTINRYQPKWISFETISEDIDFAKGKIKVIGDKKAGGTADAFAARPEAMLDLLTLHPNVHLIQVIRNPVNSAISLMRSHRLERFKDACKLIIEKTHASYTLSKMVSNPYLYISYEDLIENPRKEINKILRWLDLEENTFWLEKIVKMINKSKDEYNLPEHLQIASKLIKEIGAEYEFGRYLIN